MRNINPYTLNHIQGLSGLLPSNIVAISWAPGGAIYNYSSRKAGPLLGGLLELNNLESVIDLSGGQTSQQVNVKLSDVDGFLRTLINTIDIHKRPVFIYQWFEDALEIPPILLFEGLISSPIIWKEGERSLSFDVLSKFEDNEVGFAPEDGQFADVPQSLAGKAWPMIFGTVVNYPAIQLDEIPSGTTLVPIGIPDRTITSYQNYNDCEMRKQLAVAACLSEVGAKLRFAGSLGNGGREIYQRGQEFEDQAESIRRQVANTTRQENRRLERIKEDQKVNDLRIIPILNGHKFHQEDPISIYIGEAYYVGHFFGDQFFVTSRRHPEDAKDREVGDQASAQDLQITIEDPQTDFLEDGLFGRGIYDFRTPAERRQEVNEDPCGPHNLILPACPDTPALPPEKYNNWYADAGASVRPATEYPIRFICSITPVAVLGVSAKVSFGGRKTLLAIPSEYWEVITESYGAFNVTMIQLRSPLSSIKGSDWEDQLYVTMIGSIGGTVASLVQYIVANYTTYSIDPDSLGQLLLAPGGVNFAFTGKKNALTMLKEIAFQANLAIWMANSTIYFKYLPAAQAPVETIDENDTLINSLELTCSPTEDIITKMVATWRQDYSISDPYTLTTKLNAERYGVVERSEDFYIYNSQADVYRACSYWLYRLANTWKIVRLRTPLNKLRIQTMDTVVLTFTHPFFSNGATYSICQTSKYNPNEWSLEFEFWLPIKWGSMIDSNQGYPASSVIGPSVDDESGSFGPAANTEGSLKDLNLNSADITYNIVKTNRSKPSGSPQSDFGAPTNNNQQIALSVAPAGLEKAAAGGYITQRYPQADPKYKYRYHDAQSPDIPNLKFDKLVAIGRIKSFDKRDPDLPEGQIYKVLMYPNGFGQEPTEIKATQIKIHAEDRLGEGTIVTVVRSVVLSGTGGALDVKVKYFMQAPVWQPENESGSDEESE